MDCSESNSFGDYEVFMTTIEPKDKEFDYDNHDEKENSDDDTVSIDNEKSIEDEQTYNERHRGICESCHMIRIVRTKCVHCEQPKWAQVVSISPGWQTYLEQIQQESNKTKDEWMELMLTKGVGICFQSVNIV
jgi:hypothetical protein